MQHSAQIRALVYERLRKPLMSHIAPSQQAQWSAASVSYFIQSVLQGGFSFAKAKHNPDVVRESLAHLRRYLEALFSQPRRTNRKEK